MIDVSVIIVNYHSLADIDSCISSIVKHVQDAPTVEVLIVSNSQEDAQDINTICSNPLDIFYYQMEDNLGFAKANNYGAKKARGNYLFFLNPDTQLISNSILELYRFYTSQSNIGILGPEMVDQDNQVYASARYEISPKILLSIALPAASFFWGDRIADLYIPKKSGPVDIIQGSAMFISSQLYNEAGGMNERFFLYSEERDLCHKIREKNLETYYLKKVQIKHIGATSTSVHFLKMEVEKQKSLKKYISQYYPQLIPLFRLSYTIGYLWRTLGSALLFRRRKAVQFYTILRWYLFDFN